MCVPLYFCSIALYTDDYKPTKSHLSKDIPHIRFLNISCHMRSANSSQCHRQSVRYHPIGGFFRQDSSKIRCHLSICDIVAYSRPSKNFHHKLLTGSAFIADYHWKATCDAFSGRIPNNRDGRSTATSSTMV